MPFKFLQSIKAKHEKLKNKSKSTTDLLHVGEQTSAQSVQMIPTEAGFIQKSQSRPYLRYKSKDSAQGTPKKAKESKDKNLAVFLREAKKAESQTSSPVVNADNSQTAGADTVDHNGNTLSVPNLRTSRSASCVSVVDEANRERRISDIALLDQYINYHQRRAADDGTNTNRLVCAQLLRESFLRLEQKHLSDTLRSQSRHDLSRSVSNLNHTPTHSLKPPQYQKNNQRRLSSTIGLSQYYEPRLSVCNADTRRSMTSVHSADTGRSMTSIHSADKHDDGPIQFSLTVNSEADFTEKDRDSKRGRSSSTDNFNFLDFYKKPKPMSKRRSVPNFSQQEIEIF